MAGLTLTVVLLVTCVRGYEVTLVSILEVGGPLPFDMFRAGPAIEMGFEAARTMINKSVTLRQEIIGGKSAVCTSNYIGSMAAEFYYRKNVTVFVGPGCSIGLDPLIRMCVQWNLPVLTATGTSAELGDKETFSTLTRLSYNLNTLSMFYIKILLFFNWKHTAIIYDVNFSFAKVVGESVFNTFTEHFYRSVPLPFNGALEMNEGSYDATVISLLRQASKVARGTYTCTGVLFPIYPFWYALYDP